MCRRYITGIYVWLWAPNNKVTDNWTRQYTNLMPKCSFPEQNLPGDIDCSHINALSSYMHFLYSTKLINFADKPLTIVFNE